MLERFKDKKIAVLLGGRSREREISFKSGTAILASLERQGYQAYPIDADEHLAEYLIEKKPDAAIIALHGRFGEDGTVQGMLEAMNIPYSGSGILASAICIDKALTLRLVADLGISVAASCQVSTVEEVETACSEQTFCYPLVVKPNREGSTLGIQVVKGEQDLSDAVRSCLQFDSTVLIEEFVKGTEVTVGVINQRALPVLEIVPAKGFYDYEAKYTKGMTEYIVPARIQDDIAQRIQQESETIYNRLDLSGVVRVDYIVNNQGKAFFLEVNTIPGMTETSLIPKAAAYAGMSFDQVTEAILESVSLKQ